MDAAHSRNTRQELEVLQRINHLLSATLDLGEVLRCIITELVVLFTAQSASVILHDEVTQEAELTTTYGLTPAFHILRYPLAGSLTGWVAQHQRPLQVARLTPDEWPLVWQLAEQLKPLPAPLAVLLVPLWIQGHVVGSLEVVWEVGHSITTHEEKFLEAVAVQAGLAITNARLYQEKERALQEARERAEQLEHRAAEVAEWKQRYEAAIKATGQVLYDWDSQSNEIIWGSQSEEVFGYPPAEMPNSLMGAMEKIHPEDQGAFADEMARVLATQAPFHLTYRLRRKDETYITVEDKGYFFADRKGAHARMVGLVTDITDRIRTTQALQESETRFRRLVESNLIGIIVTDPHQIREANDAFLHMIGYSRDDLEAGLLRWPALTPPEYRPLDDEGIAELMTSGQCRPFEKEYVRKDGTRVPILIGAARFAQDPLRWICFILDLSERRQAEGALRQAKEAAEAANRTKSEFLATMSHELRTPLGIILGYTSLLLEGAFGCPKEEQVDTLRRIDRNARELLDLITAVLDLSRLEAGRLPVEVSEVEVPKLLAEIQAETQGLQERTRLAFVWQSEKDLPPLRTDPWKLKIVVKNLIGNAVKFTKEGSVTVTTRRQRGGVEICVTDTGIGIPAEEVATIFEPFRQVENPATRQQGGTGLGLHIVKRLLEILGGTVTVESEVGKGSAFQVWLPLEHLPPR